MSTVLSETPVAHRPSAPDYPPAPLSIRETGLSQEAVIDLLLRILYVQGARTGQQLTDTIRLPFKLVDDQLLTLQQRRMVEVRGTSGVGRGGYVFDLGGSGRERAREAMESNQYVGPAPVPLRQYREWVHRQSIRNVRINRERLEEGLRHIVLHDDARETLGPAINSARSLFLYGDPGNGKTMIADAIATMLGGTLYLPYAVDIDGQIMVIYDSVYHHPVAEEAEEGVGEAPADGEDPAGWLREVPDSDRRFVRVKRPVVITGGELTLDELDLRYDFHTKMYQAPFQVKANGGVLIIDDFGRQRVPARDLLNRWIVPLEKRIDYLTLHTGAKFPLPFDCLLVFSTNLDPAELAEEAFWRRIHYKMYVNSPMRPQYEEIFRRCCAARDIPYDPRGVAYLYHKYYEGQKIPPRGCHPRDLLDHLLDAAEYLEQPRRLTKELIDRAADSYFIDLDALHEGAES